MLSTGDTKDNFWSELVFTRSQVFEELLQRCPGQDDSGPRVKNRKKISGEKSESGKKSSERSWTDWRPSPAKANLKNQNEKK